MIIKIKKFMIKHATGCTLLSLGIISLVVYRNWLTGSIFTHADWSFLYANGSNLGLSFSMWIGGGEMGAVNASLFKLPYNATLNFFLEIGLPFSFVEQVLVFWPSVILMTVSSFLLVKYITKSNEAAFVGSLITCYNTYYLAINPEGHILLYYAAGFSLLSILYYLKLSSEHKYSHLIASVVLLAISGFIDFRVAYMTFFVIVLYAIYSFLISKRHEFTQFKFMSVFSSIFVSLNLFWIIPFVLTNATSQNPILNRGLFGNQFWSIFNAFTINHPFWTGAKTEWFVVHDIPIYAWILPIFFVAALLMARDREPQLKKHIYFFSVVALIGILLSKQSHEPFSSLYNWLYNHFPGFNAFREATKFYYLTILGYSVVLGSLACPPYKTDTIESLRDKITRYLIISTITFSMLLNTLPYLNNSIAKLMSPKEIPTDYVALKDFIENQGSEFRVLYTPRSSRWANNSIKNPVLSLSELMDDRWSSFTDRRLVKSEEAMLSIFNEASSNKLLDMSSVKYVVIPISDYKNDDDLFATYGSGRQFFMDALSKVRFLKKVDIGTKELLIFENAQYRPRIYETKAIDSLSKAVPYVNLSYKAVNQTQYTVSLTSISQPVYVNFSEGFHSDWKACIGTFNWVNTLLRKDCYIPDTFHISNDAGLNSFLIDPDYVRQNFPKESYVENADGSISLNLNIYFKPQSYLYLGSIISALTLLCCLIYLGLCRKRNSHK